MSFRRPQLPRNVPAPDGVANELEPLDHDGIVALVHLHGNVLEVERAAHRLRPVLGGPRAHAAHRDVVVDEALAPPRVVALEDGIGPVREAAITRSGTAWQSAARMTSTIRCCITARPPAAAGTRVEERAFGRAGA